MALSQDPSAEEGDYVLFQLMSEGHRRQELARAAWSILFTRYDDRLTAQVRRSYGKLLGGDAGVYDLVQEVWVRAYEHADTYVAAPAGGPDAAATSELWTLGWLRSLARSVHFDHVRSAKRCHIPERGTGEPLDVKKPNRFSRHIFDNESSAASIEKFRHQLVCELVTELSDRDRDVFYVSLMWYGFDDHECRIPREEINYLRQRWQIDEAYIRQIRRRVLKKVESRINALINATNARTG